MTAEDQILSLCARQELLPVHQARVEELCRRPIDWQRLAATAERHGVLPIVGANLRRCDRRALRLPEELAARLETALFENAALRERDADRLAAGLARLREVDLHAMLLKGTALTLSVYQEPWVVTSMDIDLSLRPGPDWEKDKGDERKIRLALYTHGVECDLDAHHDVTLNGILPIDFERVWADARPVCFRGEAAWIMSPEDLLISLCVNACRKRYFRLKVLFDLNETLRRGGPFDWPRLATLSRQGRCEGVVYTALTAAREILGAEVSPEMLDALKLAPFRAAVLRRLVAAFLRAGSFEGRGAALLLTYASLRPAEAWRSLSYSLTHPDKHKGEDPFAPLTSPQVLS